jgi:hypothetical protein
VLLYGCSLCCCRVLLYGSSLCWRRVLLYGAAVRLLAVLLYGCSLPQTCMDTGRTFNFFSWALYCCLVLSRLTSWLATTILLRSSCVIL